jgi:hypothetical protein
MNEYSQIIIDLHSIARALENDKKTWVFGNDLRDFADRLARVTKVYTLTNEEQIAYDYARAMAGESIDV